jgi:hypothetical protein
MCVCVDDYYSIIYSFIYIYCKEMWLAGWLNLFCLCISFPVKLKYVLFYKGSECKWTALNCVSRKKMDEVLWCVCV